MNGKKYLLLISVLSLTLLVSCSFKPKVINFEECKTNPYYQYQIDQIIDNANNDADYHYKHFIDVKDGVSKSHLVHFRDYYCRTEIWYGKKQF